MSRKSTTSRGKRSPVSYTWRHYVVLTAFTLLFALLVGRLFQIQIIQHTKYSAQAAEQYGEVKLIPAKRGVIKTADGFDLATTAPAYLISANPRVIEDPVGTAEFIVEALRSSRADDSRISDETNFEGLDEAPQISKSKEEEVAELTRLLSDKNRLWVLIGRKIEHDAAARIMEKKFKGIHFEQDQKRYYPEGTLASHVLGFVANDADGLDHGYYGIEGYFNRDLQGVDGRITLERDAMGNPIPIGDYVSKPVKHGATITLTINRGLQYLLEQQLKEHVEKNKAESGSVIVMEPDTGRVLVMANYPTYNPGNWMNEEVQKNQWFKNRAISDVYEPGSVMKAFTAASGIELGEFGPESTYQSEPYKVGDHTIRTANGQYFGTATLTDMLIHSDNTGAAHFAMKIGRERFYDALSKVGLNSPTGITLEGEGNSIIPAENQWLPVTLATAAFGQGISVTPLQLLTMMATIANDGVHMQPTILESVEKDGEKISVEPAVVGRMYDQKTADHVVTMLEEVVRSGEFRRLALQGYGIAGKTSTSQIPIAGGYDPDDTITTFVGFAPAKEPKFIMLAKLDRPTITNSAETVVPAWMEMAKELFKYYGIGPDGSVEAGSNE